MDLADSLIVAATVVTMLLTAINWYAGRVNDE